MRVRRVGECDLSDAHVNSVSLRRVGPVRVRPRRLLEPDVHLIPAGLLVQIPLNLVVAVSRKPFLVGRVDRHLYARDGLLALPQPVEPPEPQVNRRPAHPRVEVLFNAREAQPGGLLGVGHARIVPLLPPDRPVVPRPMRLEGVVVRDHQLCDRIPLERVEVRGRRHRPELYPHGRLGHNAPWVQLEIGRKERLVVPPQAPVH
mmetsp:Transcript_5244/g.13219  ORF Transcript_5244/g.13219 Transcript_5244/m.13219 type:complete len:203 (-) Transcript_5244:443-1051(-)